MSNEIIIPNFCKNTSFLDDVQRQSSPSQAAAEQKAELIFQGKPVRSLKDLREHFDKEACLLALQDGTLHTWLEQHYYEQEARSVYLLHSTDRQCLRRLCEIFSLNYADYQELSEEEKAALEAKKEKVSEYTSDKKILSKLHLIAMDQEDLADLLKDDEKEIYLCHEAFRIPLSMPGITYTGFGGASIDTPCTAEQYQKIGITIHGIGLPEEVDQDTADEALCAAKRNGYDDFSESHTSFATAVHDALKKPRLMDQINLYRQDYSGTEAFHSRRECQRAVIDALRKPYEAASEYFRPGDPKCIAKRAAEYYGAHLDHVMSPLMPYLKTLCDKTGKTAQYHRIDEKISRCSRRLRELFEQELTENADYYKMYDFDYFVDQVEIEEHDYRYTEDLLGLVIDTLFNDNIEYTAADLHSPISEMEEDLNGYINTFYKSIQSEYTDYVRDIEEAVNELGDSLPDVEQEETLQDYLARACIQQDS